MGSDTFSFGGRPQCQETVGDVRKGSNLIVRVFRLRSNARMRPYPRRLSTLPSLARPFGPPVHSRSPSRGHARNLSPEDDGLPVPRDGAYRFDLDVDRGPHPHVAIAPPRSGRDGHAHRHNDVGPAGSRRGGAAPS